MNSFRIEKDGQPIHSVDQWFDLAPPKGKKKHWVDGKSAKELAKAWFPPGTENPIVPKELDVLLRSRTRFQQLKYIVGIPEHIVRLDNFNGEHRNQDLMLIGQPPEARVVISVEAKADEEFNEMLRQWIAKAVKKAPGSNVPARADLLLLGLLGETLATNPEHLELRQQLLTGTAGALLEAKREQAQHAIFVVHEFVEFVDGNPNDPEALDRNRDDYTRFVRLLLKDPDADIKPDALYGPIKVPGGEFIPGDISLFIGKTRRYLEPETGVICSKTQ